MFDRPRWPRVHREVYDEEQKTRKVQASRLVARKVKQIETDEGEKEIGVQAPPGGIRILARARKGDSENSSRI